MSNINKYYLQQGDVVRVRLWGAWWHYGVVIQATTPFSDAIIRTVRWQHSAPINQTERDFAQGAEVSILPYKSELSRCEVVRNALNIRSFNYNLFTNNCDNFYRCAWGLSNLSPQVLLSGLALVGCLAIAAKTKRFPIQV